MSMSLVLAFLALTLALALAGNPTNPPPGALIKVTASGDIGIFLEEYPKETVKRVIQFAKDQPDSYWREAVVRQLWLTSYRLIFRPYYYPDPGTVYGQLPIPMDQLSISFECDAKRDTVFGKDVILRSYKVETYIVADVNSTLRSDPAFAQVGGTVIESFFLPLDPYLIVQRTGYDCMGEGGFPLNSVDPENPEYFYDDSCGPEAPYDPSEPCGQCHCTFTSSLSCVDSLKKNSGRVKVDVKYKRIAWDDRLARRIEAQATYNITSSAGADIRPSIPDLNHNYVTYQYVEPDSCTMKECGEAPGWRRHLNFDAQNVNVGLKPLEIGYISYTAQDASSFDPLAYHNLYYWDTCHQHPHFSAYATFQFGPNDGRKQGFCIQTTGRTLNTRWSPLVTDSWTCEYQGIETGWNDAYNAGIPCQWVDVTSINTANGPSTKALTLTSNPKNWLCEGVVKRDANGDPLWVPTGEVTATGQSIDKYDCLDTPGAQSNNVGTVQATVPIKGGGIITTKCSHKNHNLGPKRDCEFNIRTQLDRCTPNATVKLSCTSPSNKPSQVIRFCESSIALQSGLACRYLDDFTLSNTVLLPGVATKVQFKCPGPRDSVEKGGYYSTYSGPVFNGGDASANINCVAI